MYPECQTAGKVSSLSSTTAAGVNVRQETLAVYTTAHHVVIIIASKLFCNYLCIIVPVYWDIGIGIPNHKNVLRHDDDVLPYGDVP